MSDVQEILSELMVALDEGQINAEVIEGAYKALSAVPEIYHVDAVKALLRTPSSDEEQPEDYVAVKTFTSSEFHIGDEVVVCNGRKGVYLATDTIIGSCLLLESGELACYFDKDAWTRTGRNFPAIPAILEELKKA